MCPVCLVAKLQWRLLNGPGTVGLLQSLHVACNTLQWRGFSTVSKYINVYKLSSQRSYTTGSCTNVYNRHMTSIKIFSLQVVLPESVSGDPTM